MSRATPQHLWRAPEKDKDVVESAQKKWDVVKSTYNEVRVSLDKAAVNSVELVIAVTTFNASRAP